LKANTAINGILKTQRGDYDMGEFLLCIAGVLFLAIKSIVKEVNDWRWSVYEAEYRAGLAKKRDK
jgi:hypothetical protein